MNDTGCCSAGNSPMIESSASVPVTDTEHKSGHRRRLINIFSRSPGRSHCVGSSLDQSERLGERKSSRWLNCSLLGKKKSQKKIGLMNKVEEDVSDKRATVKRKRNPHVPGHVEFDQSTNPDVWHDLVHRSILNTGLILKAVLCDRVVRTIYAYGPDDFTPSSEQIDVALMLIRAEDMDTTLMNPNFQFAMEKCHYTQTFPDRKMLVATVIKSNLFHANREDGDEEQFELAAVATDRSLLVGVYKAGQQATREAAQQLLADMRDYLHDRGM